MIDKWGRAGSARDARPALVPRLQIATGLGFIAFWAAFFTIGMAPADPPPGYFEFEHSFTVPDLILASGLIYSGLQWRNADANPVTAQTLTLLCAGALIFLGLLDVSFNLRSGIYARGLTDAVAALFINGWCLSFGTYMAIAVGTMDRGKPNEADRHDNHWP